jgi:hypothetical protein
VSIYLAVEKRGMVSQLTSCFGDLIVPIVALGGFASQTLCSSIVRDAEEQDPSPSNVLHQSVELLACSS